MSGGRSLKRFSHLPLFPSTDEEEKKFLRGHFQLCPAVSSSPPLGDFAPSKVSVFGSNKACESSLSTLRLSRSEERKRPREEALFLLLQAGRTDADDQLILNEAETPQANH